MTIKNILNTLYWKISLTFLLLLLLLGLVYVFITANSARLYYQEANQKLNYTIAEHIAGDIQPFINGEVNEAQLKEFFHYVMVINPSIEVYLLNANGDILTYYAPEKKIKLERVSLGPVRDFIEHGGQQFITGDDPRSSNGKQKVFSAAPVIEDGDLKGYIYVILNSEEYDSVAQLLLGSYMLKVGATAILITLLSAFLIGLLAIWIITKNLRVIMQTVKRFQNGDLKARIPINSKDEVGELAANFNEMADTINSNIQKMEAFEKLRGELIANVSHDLRTPLAIIHGYIETLLMKRASITLEQRDKYLNTIISNTEKLEKLVGELFELSKLEAKQVHPNPEPFFMNELIQDVSHKYQLIAEEKKIAINPVISSTTPMIMADIAMIERVLQNLIDNAIKYTPEGGFINIEAARKNDGVEVKVMDTGPGIPEEELPYVFDRYHRGVRHNKADPDGAGLGLAIVKKILELHNSKITIKSKVAQGTTFQFSLPVYKN